MHSILDVYREYKIVPFLQMHQLRVAAVAKQICSALDIAVDTEGVVAAALLHDMGNILKFDFTRFPEVFQPEGVAYWKEVQNDFRSRYGDDEHDATMRIAEELGVSAKVLSYIRAVGFRNVPAILADPSMGKKVCCYADQRVAPNGVLSIRERLAEGAARYAHHPTRAKLMDHQGRSAEGLLAMEKQIFGHTAIRPDDVTDESVAPFIETLETMPSVIDPRYCYRVSAMIGP